MNVIVKVRGPLKLLPLQSAALLQCRERVNLEGCGNWQGWRVPLSDVMARFEEWCSEYLPREVVQL